MNTHILKLFTQHEYLQSGEVYSLLNSSGTDTTLINIKRTLTALLKEGVLEKEGAGRNTKYRLSLFGRMTMPIDAKEYCREEPDKRAGTSNFNFNLFANINFGLLSPKQKKALDEATAEYHQKIKVITPVIHQKELERFVIELSWKSSRIEGNTYTLLDTEKLLKEGIEAIGKTKDETQMILNHKEAFSYLHEHSGDFKTVEWRGVEHVHSLLVEGLGIERNIRKSLVGVTGSKYKPLDNEYQIREAADQLVAAVNRMEDPYSKALLVLLGISYIQPFEDGNKRTARLMANAILLAQGLSPLSYRNVDEESYREAMLVFYEINSMFPFRTLFVEQYLFASSQYLVS